MASAVNLLGLAKAILSFETGWLHPAALFSIKLLDIVYAY